MGALVEGNGAGLSRGGARKIAERSLGCGLAPGFDSNALRPFPDRSLGRSSCAQTVVRKLVESIRMVINGLIVNWL